MTDASRERLLASYGDMGQAMVVQNALETSGVPCRIGNLAGVPNHLLGVFGMAGRSVGVWVLEADAERAASLLATLEANGGSVDEEALAAEAMAAAPEPPPRDAAAEHDDAATPRPSARPGRAPWLVPAVVAVLVIAALAASRGCG